MQIWRYGFWKGESLSSQRIKSSVKNSEYAFQFMGTLSIQHLVATHLECKMFKRKGRSMGLLSNAQSQLPHGTVFSDKQSEMLV